MAVERDETMFEMQRTINDQDDELRRLSRSLRELRDEVRDLGRRIPPSRPVEIVDLTGDDDEGIMVGENEVPLMVRVERDETVVPDSEAGTLVEIQEDRRATPQIVGEGGRLGNVLPGLDQSVNWDQQLWGDVLTCPSGHTFVPRGICCLFSGGLLAATTSGGQWGNRCDGRVQSLWGRSEGERIEGRWMTVSVELFEGERFEEGLVAKRGSGSLMLVRSGGTEGRGLRAVEFGGLEWALLELSLFRWFAWCSLVVHTSRLVGCLSVELDNQLHRL